MRTFMLTAAMSLASVSGNAAGTAEPSGAQAAQAILNRTLAAHGGAERLRAAAGFSFELSGGFYAPLQARGYQPPFEPMPFQGHYVFDWAGSTSMVESKTVFPGGYTVHTRELGGKEPKVFDLHRHAYSRSASLGQTANAFRFHPLLLLRQLSRSDAELTDGGTDTFFERPVHRLQARWPGLASAIEVMIDQETMLLAGYRLPRSYALQPQGMNKVRFLAYQDQAGLRLPTRITGETLAMPRLGFEMTVADQKLGPVSLSDSASSAAGYIETPPESALAPHIRELAQDVYLVEHLGGQDYASLVLVFDDWVAAVEAPLNEKATTELLAAIQRIAPGKPLKTMILTHHHDDHAGGLPAVVDQGIGVLAPQGAEATLRAIATANRPGQSLSFDGIAPDSKRVLADKHHQVEIYNLSGNPHAEQILTIYLPSEKLLFQADMFTNHELQQSNGPANAGGIAFVRWLKAKGLAPERIAGAHGTVASRADINLMLKAAGESLRL